MVKTSFIIVAYNEEKTIGRCLKSILDQNELADYEIIVVDDGSKDKTADVVKEYVKKDSRIMLHQLVPNQGRGAARATGVQVARGAYYAFIDADIMLPTHWLSTCLSRIVEYDAVGGIAVPDGDVNYIYTLFNLKPKVVSPTTIVSGSNGLYKCEIFEVVSFDKNFRDGEDSVFNKLMIANGFKILSITSLIVDHRESREFFPAMKWLYQIGRGASRQFKQFGEVRLPDLVYFVLIGVLFFAIVATIFFKNASFLLFPVFFIFLIDIIHLQRKFLLELHRFWPYVGGVFVYWLMLVSYFSGRTTGWFMPVPKKLQKKKVMLCFDFEGRWGMPFDAEYDLVKTARRLLDVLDTYNVKAVFFVVGKIIEEYPDLIREIAGHGHEIALHGYVHDHLDLYTEEQMQEFSRNITRVGERLASLIGAKPSGFRSPFLMAPIFHTPVLYKVLKDCGYTWISNRGIRHESEFLHPGHVLFPKTLMKLKLVRTFLFLLLNWRFVLKDTVQTGRRYRILTNLRWLFAGMLPFIRHGLVEIPVHAPLDCEMVGLPYPDEPTPVPLLDYAVDTLVSSARDDRGPYNITFHDWIIGTNNRTQILERTLSLLSHDTNVKFVLPDELI